MAKILIVDDEAAQRRIMSDILKAAGHRVAVADSVDQAEESAGDFQPDVVLTDLKMPGRGGLALVEALSKSDLPPEVVVITAFGTVDTAVKAMRLGAYDYLTKPLEKDELLLVAERAAEKYSLRMESKRLRQELHGKVGEGLVAESGAMKNILEVVSMVAQSDATVLIRGESGTGKERIARLVHLQGARGVRPMLGINCAAFPETLLETELFGYEKGSFTGAAARKIGLIESAHGGTLFLDEVGDMSLSTQAKLLRVLQEREIRRVGGTVTIPIDIRVIAATHKDLAEGIRQGAFREDLFYRLNVIPIVIPPLRDRKEDIPALVRHFLSKSPRPKAIQPEALLLLGEYDWPGNVRELQAVMERITVLTKAAEIAPADLPFELRNEMRRNGDGSPGTDSGRFEIPAAGLVFEDWEKQLLAQALARSHGNMADAAKLLGMTYRTFQYRAMKFGLKGN
ncbi:MAG TPA: sigma-54 dependent transcriptional regulator [Fibrobacteria bacterium]|nr:sigma-54 dependent transcriptional regulator [Fibrobacteria bacterium]